MNNNSFDLPGFLLGEVYGPIKQEGERLVWSMTDAIRLLSPCQRIFHSDANFILAQFKDADSLHAYLIGKTLP